MTSDKEIPVVKIEGDTIPRVWEDSLLELYKQGARIKTQYDKPDSPPSYDSTAILVIQNPMKEPRIHRAFPGGIEELYKYVWEVTDGIHDHWIIPDEGKWTYTYHQRLFKYFALQNVNDISKKPPSPFPPVDQIQYIIDNLSKTNYSRRAQAITWIPTADPQTDDPPCLQRVWCRVITVKDIKYLEMNTHWRSRDAYKAAFMNIFALTHLQEFIADKISKKIGEQVEVGRYVDISDSYHLYGFYLDEFEGAFLKMVNSRPFDKRVWPTDDSIIVRAYNNAKVQLKEEQDG